MSNSGNSGRLALWRRQPRQSHDGHAAHAAHCTSLCCARRGQTASILQLTGNEAEAARLRDLGVREGARVQVMRDGDPLMVKVGDARFGIGRAAAMHILCRINDG